MGQGVTSKVFSHLELSNSLAKGAEGVRLGERHG